MVQATTGGGKSNYIPFTIMVTNPGCTFTHSGATENNWYFDVSGAFTVDYTTSACVYTSSNTAATDCPPYIVYYMGPTDPSMRMSSYAMALQ